MFKKRTKLTGGTDTKRRKVETHINKPTAILSSSDSSDEEDSLNIKVVKKTNLSTTKKEERKEDNINNDDRSTDQTDNAISTFLNKHTPVGSSKQITQASNLKTTVLMDYQPDICKDFKQTGYCGYGDNCKFLHSRDDFKAGWKLNNDWEIKVDDDANHTKEKGELNSVKDIPFKCVICKQDYKSPIVTICGHYFCSRCFSQRIKEKKSKCVICGTETNGTAKVAVDLKRLLNQANVDKY